jgi:hypothetical protein
LINANLALGQNRQRYVRLGFGRFIRFHPTENKGAQGC